MKIKPSILLTLLVLLVGVFIGGYLVLKSKSGTANISEQFSNLLEREIEITQEITKFSQTDDLDKDGLANWQEEIYGTNANNPDTDGDGYLDGEEVISGYDPLIPAPHDAIQGQAETPRPLAQNLTQLLAEIMAPRITQGEITNQDLENPLNLVSNEELKRNLSAYLQEFSPRISDQEIIVISDNSEEAWDEYFDQVSQAIPEMPEESEDQIFVQAMTSGDFSQIDSNINLYQTAIEKMREVPVPSDFAQFHQREIELFMATEKVYQAIKEINQDPFKTVVALEQNQLIREEMWNLLGQFLELLKQHSL